MTPRDRSPRLLEICRSLPCMRAPINSVPTPPPTPPPPLVELDGELPYVDVELYYGRTVAMRQMWKKEEEARLSFQMLPLRRDNHFNMAQALSLVSDPTSLVESFYNYDSPFHTTPVHHSYTTYRLMHEFDRLCTGRGAQRGFGDSFDVEYYREIQAGLVRGAELFHKKSYQEHYECPECDESFWIGFNEAFQYLVFHPIPPVWESILKHEDWINYRLRYDTHGTTTHVAAAVSVPQQP